MKTLEPDDFNLDLEIIHNENKTTIKTAYIILFKEESYDKLHCIIPNFEIHFTVNNYTEIENRANFLVKTFFEYWLNKESISDFSEELKRLGYVPFTKIPYTTFVNSAKTRNINVNIPIQFSSQNVRRKNNKQNFDLVSA